MTENISNTGRGMKRRANCGKIRKRERGRRTHGKDKLSTFSGAEFKFQTPPPPPLHTGFSVLFAQCANIRVHSILRGFTARGNQVYGGAPPSRSDLPPSWTLAVLPPFEMNSPEEVDGRYSSFMTQYSRLHCINTPPIRRRHRMLVR